MHNLGRFYHKTHDYSSQICSTGEPHVNQIVIKITLSLNPNKVDVSNKPVKLMTKDRIDIRGQKQNKQDQDQQKEFINPFRDFLQPGSLLEKMLDLDELELNGQHGQGRKISPFFQDLRKKLLDRIGVSVILSTRLTECLKTPRCCFLCLL